MATNKRVFTLRLSDEVFDKIGVLATNEHRSITNYTEKLDKMAISLGELIDHEDELIKGSIKSLGQAKKG